MLYVDIPTMPEFKALTTTRNAICVSIYLRTTPLTQQAEADRVELKNMLKTAVEQLRGAGASKQGIAAVEEQIGDLIDDDEFWRFQANSLAILVTPEAMRTFRLPNKLQPFAEVSDRFHLKPLLRALTFPHEALVLALSQGSARLLEVIPGLPPQIVKVGDLPKDAASAVRRASVRDRSPSGRIHGSEGQKVLLRLYARQVDQALRSVLAGRQTPLVLAAVAPLDAIFRSINTYPQLAAQTISTSPDDMTELELAQRARSILDQLYSDEIAALKSLYRTRTGEGRATADIALAARAATFGAIEALLVDIDESIPGTIDERDGRVTLADAPGATSYGVVDEIAGRALLSGARVLGVRRDDIPGRAPVAAILRYPLS
ncbi:MAG: hypothetical protein BroJett030_07970 [Alphaproteobacteria bacterium]|nr:MAG: hypothetical protein BroJett030_07970 [Alphaproteobacteria bacterium]